MIGQVASDGQTGDAATDDNGVVKSRPMLLSVIQCRFCIHGGNLVAVAPKPVGAISSQTNHLNNIQGDG